MYRADQAGQPKPEQPAVEPVTEGQPLPSAVTGSPEPTSQQPTHDSITEDVAAPQTEDEDDIEEYSVGEAWERVKESGRRFRKAVLYPAARMFKDYVDNSLDAADDLADGFSGKKKKDR